MIEENLFAKRQIRTFTGHYVDVFDPDPATINITDIAHSLSHQCRFAGHLPIFYSVAQHCVMCSDRVEPEFQMEALLHDASEAYILDLPSPIKKAAELGKFRKVERRLMEVIAQKFNFKYPLSETVKIVDRDMLQIEWDNLMLGKQTIKHLEIYTPELSKILFLQAFQKFSGYVHTTALPEVNPIPEHLRITA